jgi:hypothetical protein
MGISVLFDLISTTHTTHQMGDGTLGGSLEVIGIELVVDESTGEWYPFCPLVSASASVDASVAASVYAY